MGAHIYDIFCAIVYNYNGFMKAKTNPVEAAADVLQPLYGAICEAIACDGDGILATSIYNAFKQQASALC